MGAKICDYENLERACLYRPSRYRTVDIYIYNPEDDTYYLQWSKKRIRVSKSGRTGWWMPYGTRNGRGGIMLRPDPELGKDAWLFNARQVPSL